MLYLNNIVIVVNCYGNYLLIRNVIDSVGLTSNASSSYG